MNAWYFTFEFPPTHGGGLATYMRCVRDFYAARPAFSLVIFTCDLEQSGLWHRTWIAQNILLLTLNPLRAPCHAQLGHWVAVAHLFEREADQLLGEIDAAEIQLPRPDYVETADGFGIGALLIQQKACLNSRFQDIPIIVLAHTPTRYLDKLDDKPQYTLPGYWIGQMERQALIGADIVVSPSQALLSTLVDDFDMPVSFASRAKVLPNPFLRLEPGPKTARTHPQSLKYDHFFMASRMAHWKGAEQAIRALQILWRKGLSIPLRIYGEDTEYAAVGTSYQSYLARVFSDEVADDLIQFRGLVPRAQIDMETQTAYAQLHPSLFDNFPYTLLEAMDLGQIVVAGKNGGIAEIGTHGRDLFLTDVADPSAFAAVLQDIVELDTSQRARIAEAAKTAVARACDPKTYFAQKEALVAAWSTPQARAFPFLNPPRAKLPAPHTQTSNERSTPALSIVIPYFNMGDYIDETIRSVCQSTHSDWEIVLVNDGSTDSASIAKLDTLHETHCLTETQLRILTVANGGVAQARNTGAEAAKAPYLTLLDADDLVAPSYYRAALRLLGGYDNVAFVGCWIEDFNDAGRIRHWATWNAEPPIQLILNLTNCQSLVYRRDVFLADGQHDPELRMFLDDWEGVIALLAAGHRGVMIPEPLFRYRNREGSIFRTRTNLWNVNYEKITVKHAELFKEHGADIAAFLNANGSSRQYNVMGHASPVSRL